MQFHWEYWFNKNNKDVVLNKSKDCYKNNKEILRGQARDKYRNLSEEEKNKKKRIKEK